AQAVTRERVETSAAVARLDKDVADFPKGYETIVGERGITLSGGQRQRVSIARALLKDARLLVLDDCLSAVDTATEARLLEALGPYMAGRTTIVIAHRISALQHADEIVVLHRGRVVERGNHETLVAHGGEYARLYRKQQLEEAIERM
ncbi:MAG TPA: ATP-binding cassette domain-containing protein, partial [Oscillatoriaceae cyanobacterium]